MRKTRQNKTSNTLVLCLGKREEFLRTLLIVILNYVDIDPILLEFAVGRD